MSDLISRQDAIDGIEITTFDDYGDYMRARELIEELPSAEPQWIPVSERLPEALEEVLVTSKYGHVYTSRIVHGEFEYGGEVIAWMPLPKPYEGDKKR